MRHSLALPFVLAIAAPAFAQDFIRLSPVQIGEIFCISAVGNDMAPVQGILTDAFNQEIAVALDKDAQYAKKYPDEKPPLGDGLGWTATADYSSDCTVGAVDEGTSDAKVTLSFKFADYPDVNYNETLVLKLMENEYGEKAWRIDNVIYPESDMRAGLIAAFEFAE